MATKYENYDASTKQFDGFSAGMEIAQTFTPQLSHILDYVVISFIDVPDPLSGGIITVEIQTTSSGEPSGTVLCSESFDADAELDPNPAVTEYEVNFTDSPLLSADTEYAIVISATGYWSVDADLGGYSRGQVWYDNGNGTWQDYSDYDIGFEEWGTPMITPSDIITYKSIVAIGNDEVWYEDSAGSMVELTAANGDIDCTEQLVISPAFQKVFIANGSNLKIADFVNTKIATTDLNTHAPDSGNILTGGSSGAKMVVDYITSTTADAACTIYGYRTTTATFTSGETVTGTDDDGNSITFVLSANEVSNPHWYDWTVYGNDTLFGAMPNKAHLVCVYRGRLVTAGDPEYPNQWYMCRVAKPFNFLYGSDDPMSAVAGNNADAGQCPDIVRALIPFHDDYLIFGGATSMWVLRGDPVSGGSLDRISDSTGIFGANSWCFDDDRNLYFWGSGGIYQILSDFSEVKNISKDRLPDLVGDEAADASTHRVTMCFDKKRDGLVICITVTATGVNSNYFYSLRTNGFYPESLPEECGVYSMIYYDANDTSYSGLLLGCRDGYLRIFDDSAKDDDIGGSDEAITSYITYPILPLGINKDGEQTEGFNGKLSELLFYSAGGASGGEFSDSDGFTYSLFKGDDAETVLEDIIDGATSFKSDTISGTGKSNKIRTRMRGKYAGLKLLNSTASQGFVINKIIYNIQKAGKI